MLKVELPLSVPVLIASLRVIAVTNISMVSVGSVIGIGGLGTWFTEGYQADKSDQIIAGIKRYTVKQQHLAQNIAQDSQKLADVQPGTTPDAPTQELLQARQWDLRVFEDRRHILRQICEQPVLLEQRAFALSRAMQARLQPD